MTFTCDERSVGLREMLASLDHVGAETDNAFQPQFQMVDVRLTTRKTDVEWIKKCERDQLSMINYMIIIDRG